MVGIWGKMEGSWGSLITQGHDSEPSACHKAYPKSTWSLSMKILITAEGTRKSRLVLMVPTRQFEMKRFDLIQSAPRIQVRLWRDSPCGKRWASDCMPGVAACLLA